MHNQSRTFFALLTVVIFIFACSKDNKEDMNTANPSVSNCDTAGITTYNKQVKPILQANCVQCHNANLAQSGVKLDTYQDAKNEGASMLPFIRHDAGVPANKRMPQGGSKLSSCNISQIEKWIRDGSPE